MAAEFKVITTQAWIYTDEAGRVINGFKVTISLPAFNEVHELFTPTLDPGPIKGKAEALVENRKKLAAL